MSSGSSCSKISAKAMTRAAIAFLEGLPEGKTKVKTREVIKQLADSLGCNIGKGTEQYAKFKERWIKALNAFSQRVDDPSVWEDFKKKYETGGRAKAEVIKIIQSTTSEGELSTLDSETIAKLAKMCKENKPREAIDKRLARHKITLLGGERITKVKKSDLCDAILTLAGESSKPNNGPSCDSKTTIAQLKAYIQSRGWSVPSKARKAEICEYIAKMESKAGSPIAAPISAPANVPSTAPFTLPSGYENCTSSRTLSKQKIKEWVSAQGWDKESGFEGFPADRKDKATWCDFLSRQIAAHQISVKPPSVAAPISCYQDQDWKTVEDVEANLATCPPDQACDVTTKRCLNKEDAKKMGLERYEIKLNNGRVFTTYVNREQLRILEPNLKNFIIPIKPATPKIAPIVAPSPISEEIKTKAKIVFKPGKVQYGEEEKRRQAEASAMLSSLIGEEKTEPIIKEPEETTESKAYSKEYVNTLKKRVKEELNELVNKLKDDGEDYPDQKLINEYSNIVVNEGIKNRTNYLTDVRNSGPPQKWSSELVGNYIANHSDFFSKWYRTRKPAAISPIPSTAIAPETIQEPSAVAKLRQRLKDVRVQAQPPPIQIVRAESALAKATALCAGIKA